MQKNKLTSVSVFLTVCLLIVIMFSSHIQAAPPKYTVAWSIYAGWMPWDYAGFSGILQKWGEKYGIEIDL
jgi:NitT/TauT family transport system substrate-binding protein